MADGNGGANGVYKGPWWVQVIHTVGPTAAIAIFLVYVLAAQVNPALDSIKSYMATHVNQMQQMSDNISKEADIQTKQWEALKDVTVTEHKDREKALAVGEQTCVNAAKSPFQTQKCMDARNAGETVTTDDH